MQEENGGYIFISHSFDDKDAVRKIRNKLEDDGYEPLCFFLKCLTDHDETQELIKREISAREWFICVNSENARNSNWVQDECTHRLIDKGLWDEDSEDLAPFNLIFNNEEIWVWNLESDVSADEVSRNLTEGLRVHIIYAHKDIDFVNLLADKLRQKDLQVTTDMDMTPGKSWSDQLGEMIETASWAGTNIVILSKNSLNSKFVEREVNFALSCDSMIIPVYIDDVELEGSLEFMLSTIQGIFGQKPIENEDDLNAFVEHVVDEIRNALNLRFRGLK